MRSLYYPVDAVLVAQEEFHAPQSGTGQGFGDGGRHALRLSEVFRCHVRLIIKQKEQTEMIA